VQRYENFLAHLQLFKKLFAEIKISLYLCTGKTWKNVENGAKTPWKNVKNQGKMTLEKM